jgi:hypothetical protein
MVLTSVPIALGADRLEPDKALQRDVAESYWPRRYFHAEDVLNAKIAKRMPESPIHPKKIDWITQGAAFDRISKVPAPGVHPRVVMSPEDIEAIKRFAFLGEDAPPEFREAFGGLRASKAPQDRALAALVLEDTEMGRAAAAESVTALQGVEEAFDAQMTSGEPEDNAYHIPPGHTAAYALMYDYGYAFMTPAQREECRRILTKITRGRFVTPMELPSHFLINNHQAFATAWFCLAWAVEGEEGSDARVDRLATETMERFVTSLFSPDGLPYEEKKPQLNAYAYLGAVRRNPKLAGHPHLYAYYRAVAHSAYWSYETNGGKGSPGGAWRLGRIGIRGGFDDEALIFAGAMARFFYPDDPMVEMAWGIQGGLPHGGTDLRLLYATGAMYRGEQQDKLNALKRLPDPAAKQIGLSFFDDTRGWFRTRSGWTRDDIVLNLKNKADLWSAGHECSEHNTWELASHGVAWSPHDHGGYLSPNARNMILIDGEGPPRWQPVPGIVVGQWETAEAGAACFDATDGYNWRKTEKLFDRWHPMLYHERESWLIGAGFQITRDFEQPFMPTIKRYQEGFSHANWGNWHGESRGNERFVQWNRVERVMRTMHLARGKRPYVLCIDDVKKDDRVHRYEWLMRLGGGVELVSQKRADLIFKYADPKLKPRDDYDPRKARLLVRVLYRTTRNQELEPYLTKEWYRLVIPSSGVEPEFRILLYPHWDGDPLPDTQWSPDRKLLHVNFPDQEDTYRFAKAENGRTIYTMARGGRQVLAVSGRPQPPELKDRTLWDGLDCVGFGGTDVSLPEERRTGTFPFHQLVNVTFRTPAPGQVIRYTLDGSAPTAKSAVYGAPIRLSETTTVKAVTVREAAVVGRGDVSDITTLKFVKQPPAVAIKLEGRVSPGLRLKVFEDFRTLYDEKTGFFTGEKDMLATGRGRDPVLSTILPGLDIPLVHPLARQTFMTRGIYRYSGCLRVPRTGRYLFKLRSVGPVLLRIGGRTVIEARGPYYLSQRDRIGAVVLEQGLQPFELVVNDRVFYKGRYRQASKDYGHFGNVALSVVREPDPLLKLKMLLPDQREYFPVLPSQFRQDAGVIIIGDAAQPVPATYSVSGVAGETLRYTLTRIRSPYDPVIGQPVDTSLTAHGEKVIAYEPTPCTAPTANSPVASEIRIKEPGEHALRIARFRDGKRVGEVIDKRIQILKRHAAVKADVEPGLRFRTYEREPLFQRWNALKSASYPRPEGMHEAYKDYVRTIFIDWPRSFLDASEVEPTAWRDVALLEDNTFRRSIRSAGKQRTTQVFEFEGFLRVPASGIYRFDVDRNGHSRLIVQGEEVANNREKGPWPGRAVWLEAGLHPFTFRTYMSEGTIQMQAPGYERPLTIKRENLFRTKEARQ